MGGRVIEVDVRLAAVLAERVDGGLNVSVLCRRLGISRQTYYLYRRRYAAEGERGLLAHSSAPRRQPGRTPAAMEELIVATRAEIEPGLDRGARSIWARMVRAGQQPPSARTVHRVLVRRGLVAPQPGKRPRSSYRRFAAARPNGCWQLDGMDWQLADGTGVVIVRVLDDCTRMGLGWAVGRTEDAATAWRAVHRAIAAHQPPAMLLSDNSLAFNGTRRGVEVDLQIRLGELGVAMVAASPGHPQTTGKAEREHATMQQWLRARPPARTELELEQLLGVYEHIYNHQRPHQALGDGPDRGLLTPAEAYAATAKAGPDRTRTTPRPPPRPGGYQRVVNPRGVIAVGGGHVVQVGRGWEGVRLTVIRDGYHVAIWHGAEPITTLTLDPERRYHGNGLTGGRRHRRRARDRRQPAHRTPNPP